MENWTDFKSCSTQINQTWYERVKLWAREMHENCATRQTIPAPFVVIPTQFRDISKDAELWTQSFQGL